MLRFCILTRILSFINKAVAAHHHLCADAKIGVDALLNALGDIMAALQVAMNGAMNSTAESCRISGCTAISGSA